MYRGLFHMRYSNSTVTFRFSLNDLSQQIAHSPAHLLSPERACMCFVSEKGGRTHADSVAVPANHIKETLKLSEATKLATLLVFERMQPSTPIHFSDKVMWK